MSLDLLQYGVGRWVHILAGVIWVGLLFYLNVVQAPALAAAQADGTAAGITRHVAPRALLWFRWAAIVTWLAGALMLGSRLDEVMLFKNPAYVPIGVGAWLGTIMLANVWLVIWPAQRKILGLTPASDEEKAKARRRAFLTSRVNLALVFPMLFFMSASGGLFRTAFFAQ